MILGALVATTTNTDVASRFSPGLLIIIRLIVDSLLTEEFTLSERLLNMVERVNRRSGRESRGIENNKYEQI